MDIQTVKNMLGIKTDSHDTYLAEVLPLFIDQAKDWCNNSFMVNGDEKLPAGVKLYVAKAIEHNMTPSNLSGRSMGDVSYSYETELPSSITKLLAPYRKLRVI
ncbi:phage head-tail connector protein [Bacillus siamensis]|uniref:phage head-tail connector protein n=1 Tax=Bacillus siamensis TaxID=659243 RepID=UPI003F681FAE